MREFLIKQSDKQKCNVKMIKRLLLVPALSVITMACSSQETFQNQHTKVPETVPNQLQKCAEKPNCVSSEDSRQDHRIKLLVLPDNFKKEFISNHDNPVNLQHTELLLNFLNTKTNFVAIQAKENYISAESVSQMFRFVDDVEFLVTDKGIQVRSASRVGYYDFGVNRKRVNTLRDDWNNYLESIK